MYWCLDTAFLLGEDQFVARFLTLKFQAGRRTGLWILPEANPYPLRHFQWFPMTKSVTAHRGTIGPSSGSATGSCYG